MGSHCSCSCANAKADCENNVGGTTAVDVEPLDLYDSVSKDGRKTPARSDGGTEQLLLGNVTSLLYIERAVPNSTASTDGGVSSRSNLSGNAKAKSICMHMTTGLGLIAMPAGKLEREKVTAFADRLSDAGIDTSLWGTGGAKSVEHLFWEAYQQKGCIITGSGPKLKRVTRLVKVWLVGEVHGVDHVLFSRMQFLHDGRTVERKQVPLRKLTWKDPALETVTEFSQELADEQYHHIEDWKLAARKTLEERLGLSITWQLQNLIEDPELYSYMVEDNVQSSGYPGLNTMYCIHETTFRVRDPEHPAVQVIGLPDGTEFATAEGDFDFHRQQHEEGLAIGTQLNIWTWQRSDMAAKITKGNSIPSKSPAPSAVPTPGASPMSAKIEKGPVAAAGGGTTTGAGAGPPVAAELTEAKEALARRAPVTSAVSQAMQRRLEDSIGTVRPPTPTLWACMDNMQTNWTMVKKIAKQILEPKYGLKNFHSDLGAFPELHLYMLDELNYGEDSPSARNGNANMSSGRTLGDECQRTLGAFYAIFWMLRLDIDGKEGFSNGVDANWNPISLKGGDDLRVAQADKRIKFMENAKWDFFKKLLMDAGLLEEKKGSLFKGPKLQVVEKRLVSLLSLTAIHDIMKMSILLPTVQEKHSPYNGYYAGDTIGDHDHALSYIMEYYPQLLPSFRGLEEGEKMSVQFTQCKLAFNHGWFVQAEAPPGAIFTKFREVLIRDHKSQISQQDVALYFVHWLTDLAGAEPTPLAGCEKFVTKFPLPVLNSFLRSFEFVERIATNTETEVLEEYLKVRWVENIPPLGPVPHGESAVAKMRLLCMAQMNATAVLRDFEHLSVEDMETLNVEMSRTGCVGQSFSIDLVPKEVVSRLEGPAFLVYYGPAFLQNLGNDSAVQRLCILAEIYRSGRELWPASIAKAGVNVTIRIDVIKALSIADLVAATAKGDLWMLVKHNESEAFVERSSKKKLNKMVATGQSFQVLDLSCLSSYDV